MALDRRRWQFTTRSLLLLMLACACVFAWLHRRQRRWEIETARFEGRWEALHWNFAAPGFSIQFDEGAYTWRTGAATPIVGGYTIDPLAEPKRVDLILNARLGGQRLKGLYSIEGDRLTIIHAAGGGKSRPSNFTDLHGRVKMVLRKVEAEQPR